MTYVRVVSTNLPVLRGTSIRAHIWAPDPPCGHGDVLLLEHRDPRATCDTALVRVHSACLTGDVFGSLRCDCGDQLEQSLRRITEADWGIVAYLVGQEGRGIGLLGKLRAYALQDTGLDTIQANLALGHPADGRDYSGAAAVLTQHGVHRMRLLTSNPAKVAAMQAAGIHVLDVQPLDGCVNPFNEFYLSTKRRWFEDQRQLMNGSAPRPGDVPVGDEFPPDYGSQVDG